MWKKIKFILWTYWRIPRGLYCYRYRKFIPSKDGSPPLIKVKSCPYWDIVEGKPYQENGYCHYLKQGDTDFSCGYGLLWDQCKECGVKNDDWWELWEYTIRPILFFWKTKR